MANNIKWGYLIIAILIAMTLSIPVQTNNVDQTMIDDLEYNINEDNGLALSEVPSYDLKEIGNYAEEGSARDIDVMGNYAYIADYDLGLIIYDISDPLNAFISAELGNLGNSKGIHIDGNYAYLVDEVYGLQIINITDPTNPLRVGGYNTTGAVEVFVVGNFAYLAAGANGLIIVDITDKTDPILAGTFDDGGMTIDVEVSGDFAYVVDADDGLEVINISDPSSASKEGFFDSTWIEQGLTVNGSLVYMVSYYNLIIMNVTVPSSIDVLYDASAGNMIQDVTVEGNFAYVYGRNFIKVFDATDPSDPIEIENYGERVFSNKMDIKDSFAYAVGYDSSGFAIFDISTPSEISLVHRFRGGSTAYEVFSDENFAYVADNGNGLEIIDIADPQNPERISQFVIDGGSEDVLSVFIVDTQAFIAGSDYFMILDISDPENPTHMGRYNFSDYAYDIFVQGDYAYLAMDGDNGMEIIDISDPTTPVNVGNYSDCALAEGIYVEGDYAYLADTDSGNLIIINITDKTSPVLEGIVATTSAYAVSVSANYAYVADSDGGLRVIDITDKSLPVEVNQILSVDEAYDIFIVDFYVFVADGANGVVMFDITDPEVPVEIGRYADGIEGAQGIYVSGPLISVADEAGGLKVLTWLDEPSSPLNLDVTDNFDQSVSISWDVSADDGGYELEYMIYKGTSSENLEYLSSVSSLDYTDDNLIMGIEYFYAVSASNIVYESIATDTVSITPTSVPTAPQNLALELDSDNFVEISWEAPLDTGGLAIANYTINRGLDSVNLTELVTLPGSILEYLDDTVERGITYYYSIGVNNTVGDGDTSSTQSVTTFNVPTAPLNLVLTLNAANLVELTWDASTDNGGMPISEYIVYRGTSADALTELSTLFNSTLDYLDNTVAPGVTYYYGVSAVNDIDEGELSTTESIGTNDFPDAPSIALLYENDNVTIAWNASLNDGGSAITAYNIYRGLSADNLTLLITVSGSTYSYNDSTVEAGEIYFYAVSAVNDVGESDMSLALEIEIPNSGTAIIIIVVVVIVAGVAVVVVKRKGLI